MARLLPLPLEHTPGLTDHFNFFVGTLGFVPDSVLTTQRRPMGHFASKAAGSQHCKAHTLLGARNFGIDAAKLAALWDYRTSPLFTKARVAALFGFLNRWNDTMATPIEPVAESLAECFLAGGGWSPGRHRA